MKHTVILRNGVQVPALGLGTWFLGEKKGCQRAGTGKFKSRNFSRNDADRYSGDVWKWKGRKAGKRSNCRKQAGKSLSGFQSSSQSCRKASAGAGIDESLKRMGVEYLDLYLYHWRGNYPLEETVAELDRVKKAGKIKEWAFPTLILMIWKNCGRSRKAETAW